MLYTIGVFGILGATVHMMVFQQVSGCSSLLESPGTWATTSKGSIDKVFSTGDTIDYFLSRMYCICVNNILLCVRLPLNRELSAP